MNFVKLSFPSFLCSYSSSYPPLRLSNSGLVAIFAQSFRWPWGFYSYVTYQYGFYPYRRYPTSLRFNCTKYEKREYLSPQGSYDARSTMLSCRDTTSGLVRPLPNGDKWHSSPDLNAGSSVTQHFAAHPFLQSTWGKGLLMCYVIIVCCSFTVCIFCFWYTLLQPVLGVCL